MVSLYVLSEVFEKYLLSFCELSADDLKAVLAAATPRNLQKWQSLLHDGEVISESFIVLFRSGLVF